MAKRNGKRNLVDTTQIKFIDDSVWADRKDAILKGLEDGNLKWEAGLVKIRPDSSPTGKEETKPYDKFVAQDEVGMAILSYGKFAVALPKPEDDEDDKRTPAEKEAGAADYFNYGHDLSVRQKVRQALEKMLEGPEKAILASVKALVKQGLFDVEGAIATVISQAVKKGSVPEGYTLPASALAELK